MNSIAFIILIAIILNFFLHFAADILNLKVLKNEIPKIFSGLYKPENYAKSQLYLKENTIFGWITSLFDMLLFIIFWFGKGFSLLDTIIRSFNLSPVLTGLLYMGVLILFKVILSIPFSAYSTFVIEDRFGFNKTTKITFVIDLIKGFFIAVLLGIPVLALILAFFEYAGSNAWWYCWLLVTIFTLIINFIAPTWIMPLFNKFNHLEEGELKKAIFSYADSIKFPLKSVYVMDGSKRTGKSNAFFTGFGKNKRIVLFDTLIKQHTVSELVAIIAHEMGHYKKKHILQNLVLSVIQTGIIFFLLSFFISYKEMFDAFYMDQTSIYAGLIFFSILYLPIDFFTGIFLMALSRKNEYEADHFAADTTGDPVSLINALKKLSVNNLSNLIPHPFYVFLNYSHPPVIERIKAINH